jgi:hypothetical protein
MKQGGKKPIKIDGKNHHTKKKQKGRPKKGQKTCKPQKPKKGEIWSLL